MTASLIRLTSFAVLAALLGLATPTAVFAQTARVSYESAQTRDQSVRQKLQTTVGGAAETESVMTEARKVISAYESLVRRFPISGYSDNALFNAASLADALYDRYAEPQDRERAIRLYRRVAAEYPASSLTAQSEPAVARLDAAGSAAVTSAVAPRAEKPALVPGSGRARLTGIERTVLPDTVRITIALDREVAVRDEKLDGPARVFFDLKGVEAAADLADAVLRYPSDVVRQIRIGRHPNNTVRVVLDLEGVKRHSVYTLYNPFRVVVDCEPAAPIIRNTDAASMPRAVIPDAPLPVPSVISVPSSPLSTSSATAATSSAIPPAASSVTPAEPTKAAAAKPSTTPLVSRATTPVAAAPETAPAAAPEGPRANAAGGFSIARQLGLGVSRVVIDPGHGGHDPGAQSRGLTESALTLDIALRLEKLLAQEPGIEVILTRRTDEYIPLEMRTAIANRESADLFLSIHANASRTPSARGVETYFLSFAATAEAEAVAARENSAHAGEMHNLPDIIRAIALNNKLDESRDLAGMVQEALVSRLRRSNQEVRNLGVKKAPFVVLIGAEMPSVLAEVSFLTNREELQLLKTSAYKQRIAEALQAAVMRYRRSLKGSSTIALQ